MALRNAGCGLGLDLENKLAEYVRMNARNEIAGSENDSTSPARRVRARWVVWAFGVLTMAMIVALALVAYRQPELLLNFMNLRYCG